MGKGIGRIDSSCEFGARMLSAAVSLIKNGKTVPETEIGNE